MNTKKPLPYWLNGGTQTCEVCEQPYVLQDEHRCAACDAAMCVHCVVEEETGDVVCEACRGPAEGDG